MTQQAEMTLGVGARSEKGRRDENQDKMTAFSTSLGTFYIVADGMGGHRGGAAASHKVVEGYRAHLSSFHEGMEFARILQHATELTNADILAEGRSGDPSVAGMGSTVVMAMLRSAPAGMEILTAHVGDSRAYLLRDGTLTQLTHDHSAVQRMVDEQMISAEVARSHPDLNVLTRALGKQPDIEIEVGPMWPLLPGDAVLLCTDGLWGHLSEQEIVHELSVERSASEGADALVELALERGSDDNITVQILRLENRQGEAQRAGNTEAELSSMAESIRRRTTQPFPIANLSAPAMVEPAGGRAAPSWPHRKNAYLVYLLLAVAGLALLAGGIFFGRHSRLSARGTPRLAPILTSAQPCRKSNGLACAPVSQPGSTPPPAPQPESPPTRSADSAHPSGPPPSAQPRHEH